MSKGKSYNRIVFLTTLSVYLGLVLVGGTAPVLAHSALTKHFDIRNEIEFKDDLDNKPDNEEIENSSKEDFPTLIAKLLNEIKENIESGKIPISISKDFHYAAEFGQYQYGSGSATGAEHNNNFDFIIQNAIHEKFQRKAFELSDYIEGYRNARVSVEAVAGNWSLKISFSKSNAAQFAEFLNREFSSSADSTKDKLLKQIYENTQAASENNQVFIVTRLPRGSIDSLLK